MKASNALDFDDLILFAVKLLQEHADVREYYQRKFRYVLIDEYQDTNHLQYLLASLLAGGNNGGSDNRRANICVVGDDDQSIYKFRGATIENILSFEHTYKNARVIRLEQNYRSTGYILSAANDVIKNNQGRKGKKALDGKGERRKGDAPCRPRRAGGSLVRHLTNHRADWPPGDKWSDHAVLYRLNAQSNALEYAFKRSGVPYRIIGGTRFFDRAEVKDMLAYLCAVLKSGPTTYGSCV